VPSDLTIRTRLGAVDLVPFLRRDEGVQGVELLEWERRPAALALSDRGWHAERIGYATGLHVDVVREVLAGWTPPPPKPSPPSRAAEQAALIRGRLAARVLIGDRMVHLGAPHGEVAGYEHWGCRCEPCSIVRSLHTAEKRRQVAERKAALNRPVYRIEEG
jgi:hypothetical protein